MSNITRLTLNISIALMLIPLTVQAQNWPQWRGPNGNGIADKGNYPVTFSATHLWKAELPGKGGSTPIVWNDRIILTSAIGDGAEGEDGVLCYDWTGKLLWQVKLGRQNPGRHARGSGSNPSAVTDGKRIFVFFKSSTAAALDFNGKILWKTNLRETYGEISYFWDLGSSPVLVNSNVVYTVMHEGSSYLLALDQTTGKVVWKADRNYPGGRESPQSYTTPLVVKEENQTTIVVWGADHLTGHDAATGKLIWSYGGFNPDKRAAWRTIASPAYYQGIIVVPYGRGRFTAAMKTGGSGNITEKDFLWQKTDIGADVATPLVSNGRVYLLSFNGILNCLDVATGEEIWQTKLPDSKGVFYSSPTLAGDKLYICSDEGSFYVCEVSPKGIKVLNQTKFEDNFVATPVLLRDRILLRGTKNLYCIGK
ncbi:MAG: PQQ-binding-like beta-propeller repeat protein [Bacteroidales bacterium]|nr:PQQ-binding-like beta-propeller repeat protein [Bacteroidales bacterium]